MATHLFHAAVCLKEEWSEESKDEFRKDLPQRALEVRQEIQQMSLVQQEDGEFETIDPSIDIQKEILRTIYTFMIEDKDKCLQAIHNLRELLTSILDEISSLNEDDEIVSKFTVVSNDESFIESYSTTADKHEESYRQFAILSKTLYDQFLIEYYGFFGS